VLAGLLAAGFAVLMLDAEHHGERGQDVDFLLRHTEPGHASEWLDRGLHSTVDYRRALDYLSSRQDIDMSRVGALGFSMGGMMTFYLAAVEPRLRAGVAWATPDQRSVPLLSVVHFAPRIRNVPFLMIMGRSDPFYTVAEAQELYRFVASERKELAFYDGGHQMLDSEVPRVVAWLTKYLK
jgi:dienelactone hydrolase